MIQTIRNIQTILTKREQAELIRFILLNVIVSVLEIVSLALLVLFVSVYTGGWHHKLPDNLAWLFDNNPVSAISVIVILFLVKGMLGYGVYVRQYRYVYRVASRISEYNLLKYLEGSYSDFTGTDSSVQVRKILHQPIEFCHYVLTGILKIATEMILVAITISAVLWFNTRLFLLLTFVLLPPLLIIALFSKKMLKRARAKAKTYSERTLQHLQESLAGFVESNIYSKVDFFTGRFTKYQKEMTRFLADLETTQGFSSRLVEVFAIIGVFVIVVYNTASGGGAQMQIINVGAFVAAAYKIIPGIVKVTNTSAQVKIYEYTISDLLNSRNVERQTPENAAALSSIRFRDVSFYRDNVILERFSFEITKGDFVGITGPSGNGKTTFINLLLGFLPTNDGEILFNEKVANASERQAYWRDIAYVQQRPFLINDTMRANITLSDELSNDTHFRDVVEVVSLKEFVAKSGEGVDKLITEDGKNISGGQRQRTAIARALYKNANLIILDEPFSELDAPTEERILAHLKFLSGKGVMVIMITHKKDNLAYCNRIYELR